MKVKAVLILSAALLIATACADRAAYVAEVEKWRQDYEAKLKSDDGWLTVAGLYWLKEGVNTIGRGPDFDVKLTDSFSGEKFGEIDFRAGKAVLHLEPGVAATADSIPFSTIELASDKQPKYTLIETGSQTFYLIDREDKFGIRLKDKENPARRNFAGLHWFPVDESYRVTAAFDAFEQPEEVEIPNILGGTFKMKSPGILKFSFAGKQYSLQPVEEGEKLFIIFRDETRRTATYEAGRFLYAAKPVNGRVILDFNKAENPPCAYTVFATCPLPPPQNRLDIELKAGEKRFDH